MPKCDTNWVECDANQGDGKVYYWHRFEFATAWKMPEGIAPLWVAKKSASKGGWYYINQVTRESVWELPTPSVAAASLTNDAKESLVTAFKRFDQDGSGTIDADELGAVLEALGLPKENCAAIFKAADTNGDGHMDYKEFVEWVLSVAPPTMYYNVFSNMNLKVIDRRSGEVLMEKSPDLRPTDKVQKLIAALGLEEDEKVRMFIGKREMAPHTQALMNFGIIDGDTISCLVTRAAPYLHQYFEAMKKHADDENKLMIQDPEGMMDVLRDAVKADVYRRNQQSFHNELKVYIQKTFNHHDTKRNGVLDRYESEALFTAYAKKIAQFGEVLAEISTQLAWEMYMREHAEMGRGKLSPAKIQEMQGVIAHHVGDMKIYFGQMKESYLKNKARRDLDAFRALDKDGDGQLQLGEVIAGLTPNTEQNMRLLRGLGFDLNHSIDMMSHASGSDMACLQQ